MGEKLKKPFAQRKWWKILLSILLVLLLFFVTCWIIPKPQATDDNPFRIEANTRPVLIAHGGGNQEFPDNTLEAFYNAYKIDPYCMMETDVSITKDGVVILSHDTTLSRKTNLDAEIINVNYADLIAGKVDFNYANPTNADDRWNDGFTTADLVPYKTGPKAGSKEVKPSDVWEVDNKPAIFDSGKLDAPRDQDVFLATSLHDLIITFPNNTINVEIKQSGETGFKALEAVLKLMSDLDAEYNTFNRMVVASFHKEIFDKTIEYQKTTYPRLMNSPEAKGVTKFFILQALGLNCFYSDKISVFQVPMEQSGIKLATKGFVRKAHQHNIAVHFWTINDEDDMRYLCEIGADGIMTDYPSVLKQVYDADYPNSLAPQIVKANA